MDADSSSAGFLPAILRVTGAGGQRTVPVSSPGDLLRFLARERPAALEILDIAETWADHDAILAADALWRERVSPLLAGLGARIVTCYLTPRLGQFILRFDLAWTD